MIPQGSHWPNQMKEAPLRPPETKVLARVIQPHPGKMKAPRTSVWYSAHTATRLPSIPCLPPLALQSHPSSASMEGRTRYRCKLPVEVTLGGCQVPKRRLREWPLVPHVQRSPTCALHQGGGLRRDHRGLPTQLAVAATLIGHFGLQP